MVDLCVCPTETTREANDAPTDPHARPARRRRRRRGRREAAPGGDLGVEAGVAAEPQLELQQLEQVGLAAVGVVAPVGRAAVAAEHQPAELVEPADVLEPPDVLEPAELLEPAHAEQLVEPARAQLLEPAERRRPADRRPAHAGAVAVAERAAVAVDLAARAVQLGAPRQRAAAHPVRGRRPRAPAAGGANRPNPGAASRVPGATSLRAPSATRPTPVSGRSVHEVNVGRSTGYTRPYSRPGGPGNASAPGNASRPSGRPPARNPRDVRYARPASWAVRPAPHAHYRPPRVYTYRPYYTRWYCHPWYRYRYSTYAVVGFGFTTYPWYGWWVPPSRAGWTWVPGYWAYGYWNPGYWAPIRTAPVGYVYVPGWWENEVYVEGYYRSDDRPEWEWVEGYYLDDGTYVRGYWMPTGGGPDGYTWEPGFWDGEQYVDGFWRPEYRNDYVWVDSYYDAEGIYHSGYWMPQDDVGGQTWIPGWFDGNEWVEGYWVPDAQITAEAVDDWVPPEGVQDGWQDETIDERGDAPPARLIQRYEEETGEAPLALPVTPEE
ncbi:MAG: hypothetical protein R3F59_28660 [Myxococcota bacterium]